MRFRFLQLLLFAGVLAAFAGLLELTERSSSYFDLATYAETGIVRYRAASTIYWGREGYGATTIGPGGIIVNKPTGAGARVLFLGDSYTEALQVSDAEKFTELVQAQYNQRFPARPIVTLNFAISGQSATQHAADLAGLGPALRPQVVVAQLSPYDFTPQDAKQKIATQPAYLTAGPDGKWAIQRQPPPNANTWRARVTRWLIRARLFSTYARASWRAQRLLSGSAPPELANETPPAAPNEQQLAE